MNFAGLITKAMVEQGITAYRLSKLTNLSTATIYSYINGTKPSIDKADAILNALHISMKLGGE